jgi:hypothetical protein
VKPRLYVLSLAIFLLPAFYNGCSKEEYLPGLTGSMVGYLYTFDEFGNLLDDHSQVKITAFGLDHTYTAHSDEQGRFKLAEVPTGTYELLFEKNGFGVLKQFGVQHLGGKPTVLPFVDSYEYAYFLYEMPTTTIADIGILNDSITVTCSFTVTPPPDWLPLQIYYSRSSDFALSDAEFMERRSLWKSGDYYTGTLYFKGTPFEPGETVYCKACYYNTVGMFQPEMERWRSIYGVDTYFDYERNETIYPNLGDESAVFSFIFTE